MANFAAVIDPDPDRRRRFIGSVAADVAPVGGLRQADCAAGAFQAAWAAAPEAPVSAVADAGGAAILWGDPASAGAPRRIDAGELHRAWSPALAGSTPPAWNGFYAGCLFNAPDAVVIGADVLGLFPVYYWESSGVFIAATSPELIGRHPSFRRELNPLGLAGILLTGGTVGGETAWQGVQRLAPGHLIVRRPGGCAREMVQFTLRASEQTTDLPFQAQVEVLYHTLREAAARTFRSDEEIGLLLSGGRDSRLLAGLLAGLGTRPRALTFGRAGEYEMQCARRVARQLDLAQKTADVSGGDYPRFTELQLKWEHLSSPLSGAYTWGTHAGLPALGRRVATGHLLEHVLGGTHVAWARAESSRQPTFECYLESATRRAIAPARLRRLLRAEVFRDSIDSVVERMRSTYEGLSDDGWQRAHGSFLQQWARVHAGGVPWRLSFGAWPALLALDQALLGIGFSLGPEVAAERRAEDEVLRRHYPRLARLPLDANARNVIRLLPRRGPRMVGDLLDRARRALVRRASGTRERRYYYRIYDFNGPGWRAVRVAAEPYRRRLAALVNPDALNELLPPPAATVTFDEGILDSTGPKILLGLMLWSRDHL